MASWIESIDVNDYVQSLLQKETDQISKTTNNKIKPLQTNQTALKAKISSYGQIQNLISTLDQKITNLTKLFKPTYNISSSNTSVATVAINNTVAPGNHGLTVLSLAQASQTASTTVFSSSTNALNMTNTLTMSIGTSNFHIDITGTDSLQTIASNINTAAAVNNVGAFASVISTGTNQYQLVISATQTGVSNAVSISETGTGSDALNISTGVGGTGTALTQAADAKFILDTLTYNVPSNTNNIGGLNISLFSLGSSTLSVSETDAVTDVSGAINDTLTAYNEIMNFIAKTQVANKVPDPILSMLQSTLKTAIANNSSVFTPLGITAMPYGEIQAVTGTNANGDPISVQPTGLLKLISDPVTGKSFVDKLQANFAQIQSQLVGPEGAFSKISDLFETTTGSVWKIFNDIEYGCVKQTNLQINDLDDQITQIKSNADTQKNALILKYAKLDLALAALQTQTQYMTQQLEAMSKNNG